MSNARHLAPVSDDVPVNASLLLSGCMNVDQRVFFGFLIG